MNIDAFTDDLISILNKHKVTLKVDTILLNHAPIDNFMLIDENENEIILSPGCDYLDIEGLNNFKHFGPFEVYDSAR